MSFRFYDVLEELQKKLEEWKVDSSMSKMDVIDSIRERVVLMMVHVVTTPLIGSAFAYPGDLPGLEEWLLSDNNNNNNMDETHLSTT